MSALLIVDVQNDFTRGVLSLEDGPAKVNISQIIEHINALMTKKHFNIIAYTKDYHPEDHCSFKIWPKHCVAESWGCELDERLKYPPSEGSCDQWFTVHKGYRKTVDSYSAFIDNERTEETELRAKLLKNNIQQIYVCGLALDYCVFHTALDSVKYGFQTTIVQDCTAPYHPMENKECQDKIQTLTQTGVRFQNSDNL